MLSDESKKYLSFQKHLQNVKVENLLKKFSLILLLLLLTTKMAERSVWMKLFTGKP